MYIEYIQQNRKQNSGVLITEDDVANFLKKEFNIPEKIIKDLAQMEKTLGLLKENDIDRIKGLPSETQKH